MTPQDTITLLKEQYDRDTRKQLIKSMLEDEKEKLPISESQAYHFINQIFSYVLKNSNWDITLNSSDWDSKPLDVMKEVFPKIESTAWYKSKNLSIDKDIDVVVGN